MMKASQALRTLVQQAFLSANQDGRIVATAYDLLVALLNDSKVRETVRQAGGDSDALSDAAASAARVTAPTMGWAKQLLINIGFSEPARLDDVARSAVELAAGQMRSAGKADFTEHHVLAAMLVSNDVKLVELIAASGLTRLKLLKYISHGDSSIAVPAESDRVMAEVVDVLLHNDDYTPMQLVVDILCKAFDLEATLATRIMLDVHKKGVGVVKALPRLDATRRMELANEMARIQDAPLKITIEPSDPTRQAGVP